jgi:hypothetical protein
LLGIGDRQNFASHANYCLRDAVLYGDAIGGAERQVQMLAEVLRMGWRTIYIAERAADKPHRETVNGMQVLALPPRKKRMTTLNCGALMSAMRESSADLFYQRIRHPYTGLTGQIAKNSANRSSGRRLPLGYDS